jgi:Ca2+-binding RTX toxin-like protein
VALPELIYTNALTELVDLPLGTSQHHTSNDEKINIELYGEIENVTTGSGDDFIVGNEQNNLIKAGAGDDVIYLSEGVDTVYGGEGSDTFWVVQSFANNNLIGTNTIIKDFEIGIDTLASGGSGDESGGLLYSRNADGYATYTNDLGAHVILEGIEANILMIA